MNPPRRAAPGAPVTAPEAPPERSVRRLTRRIGRRGACLLLLGGLVGLYGAGQLIEPLPDRRGIRLLLAIAPLAFWSWSWVAAGLLAVACAFRRDQDWPGFAGLTAVTVPWTASLLASWVPLHDNPRGWITAVVFATFGALPLVLVGWDEPRRKGEL